MSSSSTDTAALVDVTMPQMGVSVSEGTVVEWHKRVGDEVARDETICEISTDKIDTEVPSPAAGRVAEILVETGTTVDVGTVLARLAASGGGAVPTSEASAATGDTPAEATASPAPEPEAAVPDDAPRPGRGATRASPVVARIAAEHGIDLSAVKGSGRGGRVRKQDVLALVDGDGTAAPEEPPLHIESPYRPEPAPEPAPAPKPEPEPPAAAGAPLSRMRRSIGEHMKRSLELAAHCTTIVECDMSGVERRRRELGTTYLPIVARCAVATLREFGDLNAWLEGDRFTRHDAVHLGIAVSLGEDGLIVPVVRDAQDLSDEGLARRIADLAARARDRRLSPDDVRDGTFTITNPGAFGAIAATPIINQPQVGILDLEAVVKRPVVIDDAIAIRPMANLCLSWDHRALDGAYAARFLTALRKRLEAA